VDKTLWSLWDMLQIYAQDLVLLGKRLNGASTVLYQAATGPDMPITDDEKQWLTGELKGLRELCARLELPIAKASIERALKSLPETHREWDAVTNVVTDELESRLFMFIPPHRARYHESVYKLAPSTLSAFPMASKEVMRGANCYAAGEYTACVFHAMRSAEIALKAMAVHIPLTLTKPADMSEWNTLINGIDDHIKSIQNTPRTAARDADLRFYGDANSQFTNFKDAFRNHVAHARESYEEGPASSILQRVREFLDALSSRVSEPV
jgi:hypothetical protein